MTVPNIPKDPSQGEHTVIFKDTIFIEKSDFQEVDTYVYVVITVAGMERAREFIPGPSPSTSPPLHTGMLGGLIHIHCISLEITSMLG